MLAYVFWHAPRAAADSVAYTSSLENFHAALAANPPAGFLGSFSTCATRVPWLEAEAVYEDWYLIDGSAALDPLNAAAVDVRRRGVHAEAAREVRTGTAGLYRLAGGRPIVPAATRWFAKPEGATYAAFDAVLDAVVRAGATVWQRQMILGPAPEFAAQTKQAAPFAEGVEYLEVRHVRAVDSRV